MIVPNEEHLRRILAKFSAYYNGWRPHVLLGKYAPDKRPIERFGDILVHAILSGCITDTHEISFWKRPPAYSPELNPVENIWQFLPQNQLSNRVFENYDAIVDPCCDAWNALAAEPHSINRNQAVGNG